MRNIPFLLFLALSSMQVQSQSLQSTQRSNGKLEGQDRQTWYLQGKKEVKAYGAESDRVISELIAGKEPKKRVVVAVIDSGVDHEHEDLKANLWTNEDEVPDNGKDDDGNGYIDDVHGWNFLVDDENNSFVKANLEATRILRVSRSLESSGEDYPSWLTNDVLKRAAEIYNEQGEELQSYYQIVGVYRVLDSAVTQALGDTAYTYEDVAGIESDDPLLVDAKRIFKAFTKLGITKRDLQEMDRIVNNYQNYWLNFDYQPRSVKYYETASYGNNEVGGEHTGHGTHVSGIIAASASNDLGGRGVAGNVADIMILKAVPDGDEYDMDVAKAIRYAADNGADIINMSFGKGLSPYKEEVYAALEYAAGKGLLIVHAAGNDAKDSDEVDNFPNDMSLSEEAQAYYLTVGAIGPRKNKRMLADFSNYGDTSVDVFAPGEDIYSTLPKSKYGYQSGTSMAAPVLSGVAALILAYHPEMTGKDLKEVVLLGGTDLSSKKVILPGTWKEKVEFRKLSSTGKVTNAYNSFKLADEK